MTPLGLTCGDVIQITHKVKYKGLRSFKVGTMNSGFYLQHFQNLKDCNTGHVSIQKGRKWYVSAYSTESEIVQTCLAAIVAFEEHEVRENFTYNGSKVFGPHIDVKILQGACLHKDVRS